MKGFRRRSRPEPVAEPVRDDEVTVEGEEEKRQKSAAAAITTEDQAEPAAETTSATVEKPQPKKPRRRATKRKTEVLTAVSTVTIPISQEAKTEARQALDSAIASGNYFHQYLSDIISAAVVKFLDGELGSLLPVHENSPKENVSFKLEAEQRQLYDTKLPKRRRAEVLERILRTYVNRHYPS